MINRSIQGKRYRKRFIWYANWIAQLRRLLELFPKHRGMANAFLKGDGSFRPALEKLQREVDRQLLSMRQLIESHSHGARSAQKLLQPIESQWGELRDRVYQMPPAKSFSMHTQLIALVIERMQDDSIELETSAHPDEDLRSLLVTLTRELPQIVECIGQAHGIGTGVAAQGASTAANRVNLKFLHEKTQAILTNRLLPVRSGVRQHSQTQAAIDSTVAAAQDFLKLLRMELIEPEVPRVSPEKFYQQGTRAIEAGFAFFDQLFPGCVQSMGLTNE